MTIVSLHIKKENTMNVYEAINKQELLSLLKILDITFEKDLMVVIKSSFGFKGARGCNKLTIATECFQRIRVRDESYYNIVYTTPYVPRRQQSTTALVINESEVMYFNLGKYDLLFVIPERDVTIVIPGMDKGFTKWLLRQDLDIINPRVDDSRVLTINYPETSSGYEPISPIQKAIFEASNPDMQCADYLIPL